MSSTMAFVVSRNSCGNGEESPQERLETVLSMMLQAEKRPAAKMFFYTEGLSWLFQDSCVLPQLLELESRGIELLVCQNCARDCGLQGQLGAGRLESSDRIMELMWKADHVVIV